MKYYNCFFTICQAETEYYHLANRKAMYLPRGISNENQFELLNKNECREKLNLPPKKKIILQVGRAVHYRGFDWIINLMDACKDREDLYFVMAGINKWDPYYDKLESRNCLLIEHVPHKDLVHYYNAADLLLFLISGEKVLKFGGVGYVPIEALSCGLPVVATSFHHIKKFGIDDIGRIPNSQEDLLPMIEELLKNSPPRERCRKKALQLFSWNEIIPKFWEYYKS